jgi:outer membrane protein TolC
MSILREPARVPISLPVFASLLLAAVPAPAQSPSSPLPDHPLRLADCLVISEQRQPSLIVARARLAAALSKLASLESLDGPVSRLRQDLPIRRQQARLGIEAAKANLVRMEIENRYAVTRSYLSVLYARVQRRVLNNLIEDLKYLQERVRISVEKNERTEWTATTVDLITLNLRRIEARRAEADRGVFLAVAAVREALGLGPAACFTIADEPIPQPAVQVCHEDIIAAAAARRIEVIEANLASEAAVLETDAQAARCRRRPVHTFAAAADLHANHVPQPIYREEFRPGGIPLAMPAILTGPRDGRVATSQNYSVQAAAVAQKTRNLAILEAEEAFYVWQEWSQKVVFLGEAEKIGSRLGGVLHEEFRGPLKRLVDTLLPESLLAAQTRTDYNEALFRRAVALAGLERVTGGVFCAGLATAPTPTRP